MAGTITSNLTAGLIDAADATGTWITMGTAWAAAPVFSTDVYLQGTAAINANAKTTDAIGTRFAHVTTAAALDLTISERHLYFWMKCFCLPALESRVRGGLGVYISSDAPPTLDSTLAAPWDGPTNSKVWFVSGKDFEPTSGWVCYVVDPNGTPDQTLGTPVMTSVDRAGIRAATLLGVGGGAVKPKPFLWDKMAYGTGLTIIDGTAGTPVTLADIYATDSSVTNSFGILTQAGGIYYVAGKFLFGTTGQTAVTYFKDANQVIVFQNFPVAATFYEIKLAGAASFATTVQLGNYSGGLTSGGVTIRGASLVEMRAIAPVIVSGGTGYTAGDILTVSGGTFVTAAQIKVITVASGVVTVARMETAGKYSVPPTGTLATTGGTGGNNATFTLTFVGGSIWTLTADAANQTLNLYGCPLSEMKSAALASTTSVRGCSITNSGTVTSNGATIDSCTFQDLATVAPISATYALIINSTTEMANITNSKFVNCNRAIKITTAGDYTFTGNTFSGNTYDIENSAAGANVTDIYAESNSDGTIALNDSTIGVSQSFTGDGNKLANAVFYLSKTNTPSGNAVAKVYAHSGTFASSSLPTGTALATSRNVDVTALTGSLALTTFYFGDQDQNITLTNGTKYVVTIEYSSGTSSNTVNVGRDASSAAAAGSCATLVGTTWTSTATTTDSCFYVRTGGVVIITLASGSNPSANKVLNSNAIPGAITINTGVNITVHVQDSSQVNITGAGVQIFQTSTPTNIIANTTTDGSGNIVGSTTLTAGTSLTIRVRKSSSGTRYIPTETTTTVPSVDSTITVTLIVDTIVQ